MKWIDDTYIGFDFETSGIKPEYALQPWRIPRKEAWATSLVWSHHENGEHTIHGGLFPKRSVMREMLEFAIKHDKTIVGWNVIFDISVLIGYGFYELVQKVRWLDGMLLWRHYFIEPEYDETGRNKKHYKLKGKGGAVETFAPSFAGYEQDIDYHSTDPQKLAELHAYNINDVGLTVKIAKILFEKLTPKQQRCAFIEARCLPLVAAANFQGMLVDIPYAHELGQSLLNTSDHMLAKLAPHGVTEKVIRSPLQLAKLLFDKWKLPVFKMTKSSARSTDKEVLHELSLSDPRAKDLRTYREALNLKTKFVDVIIEAARYNEDWRPRPQAIVFGTYSGRMTYSSKQGKNKDEKQTGFAIHQMKNDKRFRDIVVAPPGYAVVEFDASGQEFRWMAIASKDQKMLELCEPGQDAHSYMGHRISGLDYQWLMDNKDTDPKAKNVRKSGKVGNLCVAEGTQVLTDRGPCSIELVRAADLIWDGLEWVNHDGVVCSGVKPVITHQGLTATPDHRVLVCGEWVRLDQAQRMAWSIDRACRGRSAVRIMGGFIRRRVCEKLSILCTSAMQLWHRARGELTVHGDRAVYAMQGVCDASEAPQRRRVHNRDTSRQAATEACQCNVSAMYEPQRSVLAQLRRTWDRVSVWFDPRGGGVYQGAPTAPDIPQLGYRPSRQRWSLRAWKLALGLTQGEPQQSVAKVYDIVNCGPRTRFSANGLIVHNSLQYRTSAKKFTSVARVQYDLPLTLHEGEHIRRVYLVTYKGVPIYWEHQIRDTASKGYVETFAGRRVVVKGDWSGKHAWSMASTAINYRIQGTGADQKYLALMMLEDYLVEIGGYFAWDLHDGLYFYIPNDKVEAFVIYAKDVLDNLPYGQVWGLTPPIPLPWDCKTGPRWGSLREWKFE